VNVAGIDYGAGNLRSVLSALRTVGCSVRVIDTAADISNVRALVLPGVGAAADTMEGLDRRGLSDVVRSWTEADRPFLGICMGLQVLFDDSTEGGGRRCLGILPGHVVRLPTWEKVPHMGWNQVYFDAANPIFRGILPGSNFYFVHSYVAEPVEPSVIAGQTDYGIRFCSVVQKGNLIATQFHPEKSGGVGLRLYRHFLSAVAE